MRRLCATALDLLRLVGITQIATTMRAYSRHPDQAVRLVLQPFATRA
jgi:hypothetical protein